MNKVSAQLLFDPLFEALKPVYGEQEARSMSMLLLDHFFQVSRMDLMMQKEISVSEEQQQALDEALNRLKSHEPIQHILGSTEFYGRTFKVSPAVLIPRPETEELVHLIIKDNPQPGLKVLDIGTGSGCIPITLQKELKNAKVATMDVSQEALEMAKQNARLNEAVVDFFQSDVLTEDFPLTDLDIVVSNPPYVRQLEKEQMHANVLDYEPHLALFVDNDDPLLFYRRITHLSTRHLKPGGKLYFEINEAFGKETADLLIQAGFEKVEIIKDMQGKDRMVKGKKYHN